MIIDINLKDNAYKVNINEEIKLDSEYAILTNTTLKDLFLDKIISKIAKKPKCVIIINDGENYKNLTTLEYILNELFKAKITRTDTLINLGGGVISDIGGFAASIYKRGIKHINIATTLLACVDAAVGGKTGINNEFGKNLLGTFKQPSAVYIYTDFFKSLDSRQISTAMAEVIKMALCFDIDFYNNLQINYATLIERSVKIKAAIVCEDERESGERMKLNYGHTFAHVIENETNYEKYLHGEAVAIGMVMANELAYKLGLISKEFQSGIIKTLKRFNLPVEYKIKSIESFYEGFFQDKKTLNDKINFVLLKEGGCVIKNDVPKDKIIATLKEFQ